MVRNPATGRYVRVNSKIGRGIISHYEPKQEMSENTDQKKTPKRQKRVEFRDSEMASPPPPKHPVEIDEISRQLELLRQRLVNVEQQTSE